MAASSGVSPAANSTGSPAVSTPSDQLVSAVNPALRGPPHAALPQPFISTGPITIDPSATPSAALNPRSCVTCRRRKVRCDKHMPCGNCRKAHIQCVFPAPGRAPRRPRPKDPNAPPKQTSEREIELMKRLRKLEGIVEDLSGQIEFETTRHGGSSGGESPETLTDPMVDRERRRLNPSFYNEQIAGGGPTASPSKPTRAYTLDSVSSELRSPTGDVNKDFGRLVLNEKGKTRYVSNSFWSKINDEIDELRADCQRLTDDDSDYSDDGSTPATNLAGQDPHFDHHGFILGYSSSQVDLRKLHPLPSQIPFIWQVYIENVDPLVKILHIPTMSKIIRDLRSNMDTLTPGLEALMFSIYYAAITSLEEEEVKTNFGADKARLVDQYRYATEQALAKASFLTTSELVVVQALTIFLVLVRRFDDTRFAWTLTGLLIRIAQSLGLHREGTHFDNLSLFDIEMRRRLWWTICVLDLRAAEDQGTDLTIAERTFDTEYPLNVNDTDISPEMTEFPESRQGSTDLTFCLIRFEICSLARKMHSATTAMAPCPRDSMTTLQERETMLIELNERIDEKYLKNCANNEGDVLHWVAATIARLIMAKMSLIIYQPMLMPGTGANLSSDIRDRLFMAAVEVVEYNKVLNKEPRCKQWRWMFQAYTQWHAVAYLLLEVCRRPWTASVERGWKALTSTFEAPALAEIIKPTVWLPLRKLMLKAKRHREEEVSRLRADPEAAQELDIKESNSVPPATFQHLPSSVRNALAQENWRRLVGTKSPNKPIQNTCMHDSNQQGQHIGSDQGQGQKQANATSSQAQEQLLGHMMSEPYLDSQDLISFAFTGDPAPFTEQAFSGDGAKPQQQQQQMGMVMNGGYPSMYHSQNDANTAPAATTAVNPQPMDTTTVDNHPPPWLWDDNPWSNSYAAMASNVPSSAMDDADVNMDVDNFNWQNWMDNGLAMGRAGFTGGI
ncbi:fungal-specific transcription factor domain-containing protein [Xylariomycetidae sp. FL0641]|nr:fungal-specific transcription factor domain-containing protein [Xylariomycetidae sp. FL0641]